VICKIELKVDKNLQMTVLIISKINIVEFEKLLRWETERVYMYIVHLDLNTLEKVSLHFSSYSFVIRVNLLHP